MGQYKIDFKAVVETEILLTNTVELSHEETNGLINCITDYDKSTGAIIVDEVSDVNNEELYDMLLSLVPNEIKKNCISMNFLEIKIIPLNNCKNQENGSKNQTMLPPSSIERSTPEEYRQVFENIIRRQLRYVVSDSLFRPLAYRQAVCLGFQAVCKEILVELEQSAQGRIGGL